MFQDKKLLHFLYWVLISLFVILCFYLLIKLLPLYQATFTFIWKIIAPFLLACFIAYLLFPLKRKLEDHNIHNVFAILFIYLIFFGGFAYIIYLGYPAVVNQLGELNEHIPQLVKMYEDLINTLYESTSFLPEAVHTKLDQFIISTESRLEEMVGQLIGNFTKVFDFILFIAVIPVLVFYLLKDYDKIKIYLKKITPTKYYPRLARLAKSIDERLGGYIRGQLIVSLFISVATLIVFRLMGIDYALLLAIVMGITNIIPYFGPIIGAIPAVMIALTISPRLVIYVIIAVFVIQILESNFLSPFIVGKSVNIHPISIIFALLVGGQLAGVLGMVIAVPVLTIVKEILTHFTHDSIDIK